ncbi:hypothetical protein BpHYR1_013804 [Brachionus plicatilis]|uniref:UXT-like protein n=1 Tax=Brachionus plicatilis TaxID=10195 RepID=A0A3M7SWX0_BRAPC|nr:hypothetical protein BpHYR1_013804 [Brachionus plicatilis]
MENKSAKILEFEKFVNEKLRTDLKLVLDEQDAVYSEMAEYLQVKDTIEKLTAANPSGQIKKFQTKVDLGCNFYANAMVDDPSKIFISIGFGFYLQMKLDEALKFIDKKVKILNQNAEELSQKASEIKANIKFVLEGLKEMQNLEFKDKNEKQNLFV